MMGCSCAILGIVQRLGGIIGGTFHTIRDCKLLACFMNEIVANFTAQASHVFHLFSTNVAKFPFD
jgi:hypothetical protein